MNDMKYYGFVMPRTNPKNNRVVVHNHVQHQVDTRCGTEGFRAWTQLLANNLIECSCGWAADLDHHYRVNFLTA